MVTRVGAGVQPSGRSLPLLLPDGLGTETHLELARNLVHPFLQQSCVYRPVQYALEYGIEEGEECNNHRHEVAAAIQQLTHALYSEHLYVLSLVDPHIRSVLAVRNVLAMRDISVAIRWLDPCLCVDLLFGLPQLGWAAPAPTMPMRSAPPQKSIDELEEDLEEHNQRLLFRVRSSGDVILDQKAWEKTQEELDMDVIIGPFESMEEVPYSTFGLLWRFGTWEQHGGCHRTDSAPH